MKDLHGMTGAYVVGALDEAEVREFERHLSGCADCRAEVAELGETTAMLSEITAVAPSASVRDSVLAGIKDVRPLPPQAPVAQIGAARERVQLRRRLAGLPILVAAAMALIALGGLVWSPWQSPTSTSDRVLAAGDAISQTVMLPTGKTVTIVNSRTVGRAVLLGKSLTPAPVGKTYELWLQAPNGEMIPAGLISGPRGQVLFGGSSKVSSGAGITVEPEGGSPRPTTNPIALVAFKDA